MPSAATFPCSVPGCNFVTPAACPQRHALDEHSFRQWVQGCQGQDGGGQAYL